jgi:hypothetical protein
MGRRLEGCPEGERPCTRMRAQHAALPAWMGEKARGGGGRGQAGYGRGVGEGGQGRASISLNDRQRTQYSPAHGWGGRWAGVWDQIGSADEPCASGGGRRAAPVAWVHEWGGEERRCAVGEVWARCGRGVGEHLHKRPAPHVVQPCTCTEAVWIEGWKGVQSVYSPARTMRRQQTAETEKGGGGRGQAGCEVWARCGRGRASISLNDRHRTQYSPARGWEGDGRACGIRSDQLTSPVHPGGAACGASGVGP